MAEEELRIPPDLAGEDKTGTVVLARRGDVVFVESTRELTQVQMKSIGDALKAACERYGVQIVVLPPFLKVARGAPRPIENEPDAGGTGEHTKEGS